MQLINVMLDSLNAFQICSDFRYYLQNVLLMFDLYMFGTLSLSKM